MNYYYGVADGCYGLSVYGKQFKSREDALHAALVDLKLMMTKKIGSTDTSNDKQAFILATLRDIVKVQINSVQLFFSKLFKCFPQCLVIKLYYW